MKKSQLSTSKPKLKPLKIKVISNEKKLFALAAKVVTQQLNKIIKDKGFATMAFAGGRSAASLCAQLIKQKIDWSKVHIFMIDERLVLITDNESNFKLINDSLIKPLNDKNKKNSKFPLLRSNIHPFIYDETHVDEGAQHYAGEVFQVGGSFDIIFVSAGEDGHIAGLYPNHPLLNNKTDLFATFHDSPKPPAHRMTALPKLFMSANFSLLLVIGDTKRDALKKLKNKKLKISNCPAKLVATSKSHLILTNLTKQQLAKQN